jgi:ABC-2 type transport system ATP-binding protein
MKTTSTTGIEALAELRGAVKRYGPVTALAGIDFAVRAGEVVALLGPNGAGKTTAVQLLLGLSRPSAGQARLFGFEPRDRRARVRVGAMLQVSNVPETLKVREHVELVSSYYPNPLPRAEVMAAAGLSGIEDRLFGKLSGGQRQRVLFALALCGDPDLLFLDEPTVGLDVESRRAFWSVIQGKARQGRSVLLTTHYLEEADALADRIVVVGQGRIVAEGSPAEIKTRAAGRKVRCRTSLSLEDLAALPGVRSARRDGENGENGEITELFAADAERVVRELMNRDPRLSALEVRGADLEEAFLALTGPQENTKKEEVAA